MERKEKYTVTNINELENKLKKAHALSEDLAHVLKEIDEFEIKTQFDE